MADPSNSPLPRTDFFGISTVSVWHHQNKILATFADFFLARPIKREGRRGSSRQVREEGEAKRGGKLRAAIVSRTPRLSVAGA